MAGDKYEAIVDGTAVRKDSVNSGPADPGKEGSLVSLGADGKIADALLSALAVGASLGANVFTADQNINGLTVGRGGGNVATNTAMGLYSLNTGGASSNNAGFGAYSGPGISTGYQNTMIGSQAGYGPAGVNTITTGNNSTYLGYATVGSANNNTNETVIGANAVGNGSNTMTFGDANVTANYFNGAITVSAGKSLFNTAAVTNAEATYYGVASGYIDGTTNTYIPTLAAVRRTSGTPAAGIGAGVAFVTTDGYSNVSELGSVGAVQTDLGNIHSDLVFYNKRSNVSGERMRIASTGDTSLTSTTDSTSTTTGSFVTAGGMGVAKSLSALKVLGGADTSPINTPSDLNGSSELTTLGTIYAAHTADSGIGYFDQVHATSTGAGLVLRAAKGTPTALADVADTNMLGYVDFRGYSGTKYFQQASIAAYVDGTFTTGQAPPSRLMFATNAANGVSTERMRISNTGTVTLTSTGTGTSLAINAAEMAQINTSTTGTNAAYTDFVNTGGTLRIGRERSAGGGLLSGTSAYDGVLTVQSAHKLHLGTNSAIRVTIDSGGTTTFGAPIVLKAYTVATLPAAPGTGAMAYVTDATAPTYLGALTGGGAVVAPVFYNGAAWISH